MLFCNETPPIYSSITFSWKANEIMLDWMAGQKDTLTRGSPTPGVQPGAKPQPIKNWDAEMVAMCA